VGGRGGLGDFRENQAGRSRSLVCKSLLQRGRVERVPQKGSTMVKWGIFNMTEGGEGREPGFLQHDARVGDTADRQASPEEDVV